MKHPSSFLPIVSMALSFLMVLSFSTVSLAQTNVGQSGQSSPIGTRIVGTAALNVRSKPMVGDNIIGHVNRGDQVNVLTKDRTGSWCQIEFKDTKDAWVYCPYLMKENHMAQSEPVKENQPTKETGATGVTSEKKQQLNPSAAASSSTPSTSTQNGQGTVNVGAVNVRSSAAMGSNVIGHLNRGDVVTVKGTDRFGFWCTIDFKGHENAFIACKFLDRK